MTQYLLVGRGRLARHFGHYLSLLNISFASWNRSDDPAALRTLAESADRTLLLISDSAIADFLVEHPYLQSTKTVHCSGSLSHPQIQGAHPLMTFGPDLYDLATYVKIPFVCEEGGRWFAELLPHLPNPHFSIQREKKSYYHALCALSGNFTSLLWESTFHKFAGELGLPADALKPYLERVFLNLMQKKDAESVLTGPLQRGDTKTLIQHLDALHAQPEQALYFAFMNYYFAQNKNSEKNPEKSMSHERLGI